MQQYYGRKVQRSVDLATDACCTADTVPAHLKPLLAAVHPEVASRYYGCGLVAPDLLAGAHILDLGCGTGQDCYVLSALVGEHGTVTGVDMTDEQLAFAERYLDHHREQNGHAKSNVRFLKGYIEQLDQLDFRDQSFDVIVSNCVINLSPDKEAVLRQAHRLLKPGGELYFSDVYADRRVPRELLDDPVLYGECLSGALYWHDFLDLSERAGFANPRLVTDRPLAIQNAAVQQQLGAIRFFSATYRLFRLDDLEPACEDYGQTVTYKGTIPHAPERFALDAHHVFETGKVLPVCGNTWRMLQDTRFAPHFEFVGDFTRHFGIFAGCGTSLPFASASNPTTESTGGCC